MSEAHVATRRGGSFFAGAPWLLFCVLLSAACAPEVMPDPRDAARAYADALERSDVDTLHQLMSSHARQNVSKKDLVRFLTEDRIELEERGRTIREEKIHIQGSALIFLQEGQIVGLTLEEGNFLLENDGVLPARSHEISDLLALFRRAVQARDAARILALLSKNGQAALSEIFNSLDLALMNSDQAVVNLRGDKAVLEMSNGLVLTLKREDGLWLVDDIR